MRLRGTLFVIACGLLIVRTARADDFKLKIIAFNDFHGNLQSPGKFQANAEAPKVPVGGVDFLAGYVQHLKAENPDNVVIAAGDLISASPLVSALFDDEDTIEAMNRLGLELSSVGNHEFDKGKRALLRMQSGGCSKQDRNTCQGAVAGMPVPFEGAKFRYLAANVIDTSTGKTLFPGYAIKSYHGVRVAFIGLVLKETPTMVTPSGVAGLRFTDEATAANAIVQRLSRQGVKSFVVLIHQGGAQTSKGAPDINACVGDMQGTPIRTIVGKLDNAVDLVVSAHTHQPYICQLPNRAGRKIFVTSAALYGEVLTNIDVTIDQQTKDIKNVTAQNILVDRTNAEIKPDAALATMVDKYALVAAPIANRPVGTTTAEISKTADAAGESPMGDLIADAELEATSAPDAGHAVAAFMNEGGIRSGIPFASSAPGVAAGKVTYGELYTVQPFSNTMVTMTLTGAQIKMLLEEQFQGCAAGSPVSEPPPTDNRFLQVSEGFAYTWNPGSAVCAKVDAESIKIHGATVRPSGTYRITVNSFMADGGDRLNVLKQGTNRLVGVEDLEAMKAYFLRHGTVTPANAARVSMKP